MTEVPLCEQFIRSITTDPLEIDAFKKLIDCSKQSAEIDLERLLEYEEDTRVKNLEYDDSKIKPAATLITNKVRLDNHPILIEQNGKIVNAVHARYINDSIKQARDRFLYFSVPAEDGTQNTIESFKMAIDRDVLMDYNTQATQVYENAVANSINPRWRDCIPPEVYTHKWSTFNRNFLTNRNKNTGIIGSTQMPIDPKMINSLKLLFPTYNEQMIRKDYDYLVQISGLSTGAFPIEPKTHSTVVQRVLGIIQDCTNVTSLNATINKVTNDILDKLVFSKFTIMNPNNIRRNMTMFKLAFLCGSSNDTILKDITQIDEAITEKIRSFV